MYATRVWIRKKPWRAYRCTYQIRMARTSLTKPLCWNRVSLWPVISVNKYCLYIRDYFVSMCHSSQIYTTVSCLGVGDPERMSALRVEQYLTKLMQNLKMNVINDVEKLKKEYPLFAAVNRAASVVARHQGRIIFLEYEPPETACKTLMLVGKGVTYDTGGADIKAGGVMAGMCRDKCGAATVAGFMQVCKSILQCLHTSTTFSLFIFLGSTRTQTEKCACNRSPLYGA